MCTDDTYETPLDASSVTYTPPPACANAAPDVRGSDDMTVHPVPPVGSVEQSVHCVRFVLV